MTIGDRDKTLSVNSAEERVLELAERVFLEAASSEEMAELESLLSAAPGLRRIYLRYALLQSQLAFTTASLCGDISLQPTAEVHSTLRPSRTLRDTLACCSAADFRRSILLEINN
jgi:hypothetical protein